MELPFNNNVITQWSTEKQSFPFIVFIMQNIYENRKGRFIDDNK